MTSTPSSRCTSRQSLMFSPKKEKWIKWPFRTRPLAAFIGRHNLRGPGPPRHAHIPTTDFIAPAILGSPGVCPAAALRHGSRSEEHTSELQSRENLVCRLLLEKKKTKIHANLQHTR